MLPGEVTVTPPKEVTPLMLSELSVGENGGTGMMVDIYDGDGKGWFISTWNARTVFYHGASWTREAKCKLSGPLDECHKQ